MCARGQTCYFSHAGSFSHAGVARAAVRERILTVGFGLISGPAFVLCMESFYLAAAWEVMVVTRQQNGTATTE